MDIEREGESVQSNDETGGNSNLMLNEGRRERSSSTDENKSTTHYRVLLAITYISLFLGSVSASLLTRFYFVHQGSSRWVSTWVQSAGFPLLLLPIYLPCLLNSHQRINRRRSFSGFTPKLLLLCVIMGSVTGLSNFLVSWGLSYLPLSTSSLLLSSQLAFNLIFSVLIVKQRVFYSNLNAVFLITLSSILIAIGSRHDKPKDITQKQYFLGFFAIISTGLLFALFLPIMEVIYKKMVHCYEMVVEMQFIMGAVATALATFGMVFDGGFKEMRNESNNGFDLGMKSYVLTVGFAIVAWQLSFMGSAGMIFLTTALTDGICMTALLSMNVLGGVLVFGDAFGGTKVVSTVMCVWGFCSYVYGEYRRMVEKKRDKGRIDQEMEMEMERIDVNS